jgi:hypothetical protein
VNIYLYHTAPSAALSNMDMLRKVRGGELAQPPVALTLHYLVSAYGHNDDETAAHILLGQAMRIFHDNAVLDYSAIRAALGGNDLYEQVERVRISPQPLTIEEISKLWTAFQTQYRISAAYRAEVVLIESRRPARAALPVLQRGPEDQGPSAVAGNSLPILEEVKLPDRQSSALLGNEITLIGQNLGGLVKVRFTMVNAQISPAVEISVLAADVRITNEGLVVPLPNDAAAHTAWAAGFYTVAAVVSRTVNGTVQSWSSNELPLSIAPRIESISPVNPIARDPGDNVTVTLDLTCSPEVRLGPFDSTQMRFSQQVALLLGSARQVAPEPPPAPPALPATPPTSTDQLKFIFPIQDDEVGDYLIRLRVDGVDLPIVDRTMSPPRFDPKQTITIV